MAEQISQAGLKTAVFAGGCFWCMEKPFDKLEGVVKTTSGYAGGSIENPSYEQVSSGQSGHREVLQVTYDPAIVSYDELLAVFWRNVDPFDARGQFCDKGFQYTAAIFAPSEAEKELAEQSKASLEKQLGKEIVTAIVDDAPFYPAEDYHQDYYQNNPVRYTYYRDRCGRDERLKEVWGEDHAAPDNFITRGTIAPTSRHPSAAGTR